MAKLKRHPFPVTARTRVQDRVYWEHIVIDGKKCFMKRNTEPKEFDHNMLNHRVAASCNGANRLRNEKLALDFAREKTNIPVPNVVFYLDEGERVYLATEWVEGIPMSSIENPKGRQKVIDQLDAYVSELETHRSSRIRGFGLDVCFPPSVATLSNPFALEQFVKVQDKPFVLCHGDLHTDNVLVDPITFKITAIIDWEYAGYYPADIDPRRYKYGHDIVHLASGTYVPLVNHGEEARKLIESYRVGHGNLNKLREMVVEVVEGVPVIKRPFSDSKAASSDEPESKSDLAAVKAKSCAEEPAKKHTEDPMEE